MAIEVCAQVWFKNDNLWTTELCHLRIVDGKTLRFKVIKKMGDVRLAGDLADMREGLAAYLVAAIEDARARSVGVARYMNQSVNPHLVVRSSHVHELFPETKSMPFKIACDYVRDRL